MLLARASQLNLPLQLREYQADQPAIAQQAGSLTILPVKTAVNVVPGKLDVGNSHYVVETLAKACDGAISGEFAALVTGPVQKVLSMMPASPSLGIPNSLLTAATARGW